MKIASLLNISEFSLRDNLIFYGNFCM